MDNVDFTRFPEAVVYADDHLAEAIHHRMISNPLTAVLIEAYRREIDNFGFHHDLVGLRAVQLTALFGPPKYTDKSKNIYKPEGFAMWINPTTADGKVPPDTPSVDFFLSIAVSDDIKAHGNHIDFLRTTAPGYYMPESAAAVSTISESITVGDHKETTSAGCHFLGANLASHMVAAKVGMGHYTDIVWARQEYASTVKRLSEEFHAAQKAVEHGLSEGSELRGTFHRIAIEFLRDIYTPFTRIRTMGEKIAGDSISPEEQTGTNAEVQPEAFSLEYV